jgi:8-oxo-dGTP pyrophosphatase MutT (NUDIX family)
MLEKSCGAVLFTTIQGQRHYVLVKGGYVGLPKGHVEPGESQRETALREIREETCVQARLLPGFRRTVQYQIPGGNEKQVVYFLAEFSKQEAHRNPKEFLKVLVLPYPQALRALTFPNDRKSLRAAEHFLKARAERRKRTRNDTGI